MGPGSQTVLPSYFVSLQAATVEPGSPLSATLGNPTVFAMALLVTCPISILACPCGPDFIGDNSVSSPG